MAHYTGNVGRPQLYSPQQIEEIAQDLATYIDTTSDPTIVGFTSSYIKYRVNKDYISDHQEFSDLTKRAVEKQEAYLLTKTDEAPVIRIFRLKQPQHGYKDRTDTDITTGGDKLSPLLVKFIGEADANRTDS